jgi:hypothetical protein
MAVAIQYALKSSKKDKELSKQKNKKLLMALTVS